MMLSMVTGDEESEQQVGLESNGHKEDVSNGDVRRHEEDQVERISDKETSTLEVNGHGHHGDVQTNGVISCKEVNGHSVVVDHEVEVPTTSTTTETRNNQEKEEVNFALIPGERIKFTGDTENGFLALTNYRLIIGHHQRPQNNCIKDDLGPSCTTTTTTTSCVDRISLPLGTIDLIEQSKGSTSNNYNSSSLSNSSNLTSTTVTTTTNGNSNDPDTLHILTKHVKTYNITFNSSDKCYQWYKWLNESLIYYSKFEHLFCFNFYAAGCKLVQTNSSVYYSLIQQLKKTQTNGTTTTNGINNLIQNGGGGDVPCDDNDVVGDTIDTSSSPINGVDNGSDDVHSNGCCSPTSSLTSSPRVSINNGLINPNNCCAINNGVLSTSPTSCCTNGHSNCLLNNLVHEHMNGSSSITTAATINGLSMSASNLSLYQLPFTSNDCQHNGHSLLMTSSMTSSTTSVNSTISSNGHCNDNHNNLNGSTVTTSSASSSSAITTSSATNTSSASSNGSVSNGSVSSSQTPNGSSTSSAPQRKTSSTKLTSLTNLSSSQLMSLLSTDHSKDRLQYDYDRLEFNSIQGSWRVSHVNINYKLCSSYPEYLIVPARCKDEELIQIGTFRSFHRIPTIVWRYKKNGCTIARSSQPEVGWLGWRSQFDENLIASIVSSCFNPVTFSSKKLLILDARSYAAAVANRAKGGGCECAEYYPSAEVQFMGLANIHSIRKSFQNIRYLCQYNNGHDVNSWQSQLDGSRWLHHIAGLIKTALIVVNAIDVEERPVLVHCSDGWDRTPQIVSLAEMLLDPFYRTMFGFEILIQREWIDFGHKFADRCSNGSNFDDPNERCPVFLQWLDCVHQIVKQFPNCFEFNLYFLEKLILHVHSCLFGTFTCNNQQERVKKLINKSTFSLWLYLNNSKEQYLNKFYVATDKPLRPSTAIKDMIFWTEIYGPAPKSCDSKGTSSATVSNGHPITSMFPSTSSSSADLDSVASPFSYIFKLLRMDRTPTASSVVDTSTSSVSDANISIDDESKVESMEMSTSAVIANTGDDEDDDQRTIQTSGVTAEDVKETPKDDVCETLTVPTLPEERPTDETLECDETEKHENLMPAIKTHVVEARDQEETLKSERLPETPTAEETPTVEETLEEQERQSDENPIVAEETGIDAVKTLLIPADDEEEQKTN